MIGMCGGVSRLSLLGLSLSWTGAGEGGVSWRPGAVRLSSTTDIGRERNCSDSAFGGFTGRSSLRTFSEVMSRMVWNVKFLGSSEKESSFVRQFVTSASMYRLTRPSKTSACCLSASVAWLTADTAEDFLPMVLMLRRLLSSY